LTLQPLSAARHRLDHAYLLLTLTTLMWGGNAVASKLAVGHISPMVLTSARWILVCLILLPLYGKALRDHWRTISAHRVRAVLMGTFGFTGFNALFYLAGHHTSAVNISIMQGSIPILVLIGALVFFGVRATWLQIVGVVVTLGGVAMTATHGDITTITQLSFNIGDVWMLIACAFYTGYTLALRGRPDVPGLVFFLALAIVACLTSLPLLAWEIAAGDAFWPTLQGYLVLAFVAVFPSLLSQITFMRGVELIGPSRAGVFVNLVPVFGALLAVVVLGEPFGWHHAVAMAMVLGGIFIAERLGRTVG